MTFNGRISRPAGKSGEDQREITGSKAFGLSSGLPHQSSAPTIDEPYSPGLIYLYIIDPNAQSRTALHTTVSQKRNAVVRAYASPEHFWENADDMDAGCVLYNDPSSGEGYLAEIENLRAKGKFHCIVRASQPSIQGAVGVIKAGATDYIDSSDSSSRLDIAIDEAIARVRHDASIIFASVAARKRIASLSGREREVLSGLVDGKSNKMIALELNISPRTIEIYRAHLMAKLGVQSLSETLRIAFAAGVGITPTFA